jgi:hypothetical protein
MVRQKSGITLTISSAAFLVLMLTATTFNNSYIVAHAKKEQHNDGRSTTDTHVISKDTIATDITDGSPGTTVGTMFLGCEGIVSKNDSMAASVKPACDSTIKYVMDYCVEHMTDSMAKQSLQVCWDKDSMDSGFEYALEHLDNSSHDIIAKQAIIVANRINEAVGDLR